MKKLIVLLLVLTPYLAAAADLSGVWAGKGGKEDPKYGSVPVKVQMTLLQAGSSVTGTIKMDNGPILVIPSGNVSGNSISFAVGNGTNGRGTGTFTWNGSNLSGRLTSSRGEIVDVVFTH
jgi:hypothetical protein